MAQRNASRTEAVKAAERRAKKIEARERADLAFVMSDPRGRRFIWKMMADCGIYRGSFTGNSQTFFFEGERNVGLRLTARLTTETPEEYLTMQREAMAEAADQRAADAADNEGESDG